MTGSTPSLIGVCLPCRCRTDIAVTAAASAAWRTGAVASPGGSPGRRQAPASAVVTVPASDVHVLGAGVAPPGVLLARLHELAPGDTGRAAARTKAINSYLPMSVSRRSAP